MGGQIRWHTWALGKPQLLVVEALGGDGRKHSPWPRDVAEVCRMAGLYNLSKG